MGVESLRPPQATPVGAIPAHAATIASGGMPVESLGLSGMIPAAAISFANFTDFRSEPING
jgi:hypothetical protein